MHQFCPKIVLMLQCWCRWCKGNFWGTCNAISLACTFSSCMTHKSVRVMPLMHKSIIYHMRCSSTEPFPWPHIWYVCNLYYIFFFLWESWESKLSKFISCHMGLFCCYFGGTKRKGRFTFRLSWIKMQESTIPEMVIISFHNPGAKSKWHRPNWTNLVLNQVGLVRRLKCFILVFICVCQIKPGTFLWGSFYQDGQFKHMLTYNIP